MQKSTIKKISILGLVLTTASAVTAAILPANDNNSEDRFALGSLTKNSAAGGGAVSSQTCEVDTGAVSLRTATCNISASETSEDGGVNNSNSVSSANNDNGNGENNTSDSGDIS